MTDKEFYRELVKEQIQKQINVFTRAQDIMNAMNSFNVDFDGATKGLKIPEDDREEYRHIIFDIIKQGKGYEYPGYEEVFGSTPVQ